ncbi:MAG TPA: hypothetical protein VE998_12370 [Terriglobales bacterium]|nr:hypothetical protein [Terriglobales bacterium]
MAENIRWLEVFAARAAARELLPWSHPQVLTIDELRLVTASLQQFQLGEGSDGSGLVRRARKSRLATLDHDFIPALELFIKEEQRHSRHLARFLQREGAALLRQHWVDQVFRHVRKCAGLELCLRVLVMAEIVAVPYYTALQRVTTSPLLQALCANILGDEADHLRFQAANLALLRRSRRGWDAAEVLLWRGFQVATLLVVWHEHRQVLEPGGYTWNSFRLDCARLLSCVNENRFEEPAGHGRAAAAN